MALQTGMGTAGIVAVPIPPGGLAGQVLTKTSNDNYDLEWAAAGGGASSLQDAYDNAPAVPQITIDATPNPLTIDASVAGTIFEVRDTTNAALLSMATGGSTLIGGTAAGDILTLRGSTDALFGDIEFFGEMRADFDPTGTGLTHYINIIPTYTGAAGLNGGFNYSPNITVTSAISIIEALRGIPTITQEAATAFSAFTLFQALPIVRTVNVAFNPMQALILNAGPTNEVSGAIAPPANPSLAAVNFAPQVRALTAGGTSSVTAVTGMTVSPVWSTVAGSTSSMGTITGVRINDTAAALFQPVAGTELITNYFGLDMANVGVFAPISGTVAVVRGAVTAGAGRHFLLNTSTAQSDMGSSNMRFNDLNGVIFGTSDDFNIGWAAGNFFFLNFASLADQIRISNPSADRFLFDADSADHEFNFNCNRFSLGAQTGAVGNQIGVFVAPAVTVTVAGEFSQFLLTQAGNITVNANIDAFGWTINAPSFTAGTGTLTTAAALNVGGNPGLATTNRVGVRIISNPSGGSGVNAALWLTAGLAQLDGGLNHAGNLGFYGTAGVAQSAAYTVTNPVNTRAFDTTTVTLQTLAEVVGEIIGDLQANGMFA